MPQLPGSIARYGSVDLLDLDHIELYFIARAPGFPRAGAKLQETERRWVMFDWATFMIHERGRNEALFRDLASAFLLSFEATLQVAKEEGGIADFETWLRARPAYDLITRGLRTLRHLEAHVRPGVFTADHASQVHSRFAHSALGGTIGWRWEAISGADLAKVTTRNSKLAVTELDDWNVKAADLLALGLMRHGLASLKAILEHQ